MKKPAPLAVAIGPDYKAVIVQHLEVLLERARAGELVCLTCVVDDGATVQATSAGRLRRADVLLAFETWKNDILFSDD